MSTTTTHRGGRGLPTASRRDGVGAMLRDWRQDRRRSQMDLALDVGVSTRHLSCVETGKAKPSPELVLALARHLDVPLRQRNDMLMAAGYAPRYEQTPLDSDAMASVRSALATLITAHDPHPAVVVDRHWNVIRMNDGAHGLVAGVDPALLGPPLNTYRVSLHPNGMAPRIVNCAEWAGHLIGTLERQVAATRDPVTAELLDEVRSYPNVAALDSTWTATSPSFSAGPAASLLVPLRLRDADGHESSWFSTNTSLGTPVDITLDELHIELFHPLPT